MYRCIVAALMVASGAHAQSVLYGTSNDEDSFFTIDQATGAADLVGPLGFTNVVDLASDWRPGSFTMWGVDSLTNTLVTIDTDTGMASPVGMFGTPDNMESIAFDPASDRMFGTTTTDVLYEIDPDTGVANVIGPTGFGSMFALAFDLDGTLYGVSVDGGVLLTIDLDSGEGTTVAGVDLPAITDMAARPEDGVMFAVDTPSDSIYTIDLDTGESTLVGPHGQVEFMVGLAFSPVPSPGALSVLALAMISARRRRR